MRAAMFSPARMRKVRILSLERDSRALAEALGRLGVLQLRRATDEEGGRVEPGRPEADLDLCRRLQDRLDALVEHLGDGAQHAPPPSARAPSLDEITKLVDAVESRLTAESQQLAQAEQGLTDTAEIMHELEPYRGVRGPLRNLTESAFLAVRVGTVPRDELAELQAALPDGVLLVPLDTALGARGGPVGLLAVSSRRRRFAMETVLDEHGFEDAHVPAWAERTPADVYAEAVQRHRELQPRVLALRENLRTAAAPFADGLRGAAASLRLLLKVSEAEGSFGSTWAAVVIWGWVPEDKAEDVRRVAGEVTGGRALVEIAPPTEEDIEQGLVPSCTEYSAWLSPFARLVQGYGVAAYTEIEPTILFAVSFLLLFGVVFGDLGHGLCLMGVGLLVRRMGKSDAARDIGSVIAWAGGASVVFGTFVQGSFFGKSLLDWGFPLTLGFEPIRFGGHAGSSSENVTRYLILALLAGMFLISLGAILNVVNRLRSGDLEGGLLGRFGVVGIIFYWGVIGLGVKLAVVGSSPSDAWIGAAVIGLPLVVLILHAPVHALLRKRRGGSEEDGLEGGLIMGMFEGLIEGMETVMTYVSNTFSFLRVAAFALSHVALCYTIFVLQSLVADVPGGPILSAAVFVVGTAVLIGLEGLIVTIQILRLEYYEFFTKFFKGGGIRYEPFKLD
jgi:V/A-type H+-transporting ATPase subunit I